LISIGGVWLSEKATGLGVSIQLADSRSRLAKCILAAKAAEVVLGDFSPAFTCRYSIG